MGRLIQSLLIAAASLGLLTGCGPEEVTVLPTATPTPASTPTPSPSPTPTPEGYTNPVFDNDFPDPDILQVGDTYYAYATNSNNSHVQVIYSTDLVNWQRLSDALPVLPTWAVDNFGWTWAPDVTVPVSGDGYVMYYTTRFAIGLDGTQCIGVATSDTPEGPFQAVGEEPFICQLEEGGSIDAASFADVDGTPYLLWKNDGNSAGGQTFIYIQQLAEDGLSLLGEPTRLITRDKSWEGVLVEGPTLWLRNGKYYLFYSANDYASPNYAVGYAVADSLLGPYEKPSGKPILATSMSGGVVGPGGQDIVQLPNGDTWLLFHAWSPSSYRHLDIALLEWPDGVPTVANLSRDPQPEPILEGE